MRNPGTPRMVKPDSPDVSQDVSQRKPVGGGGTRRPNSLANLPNLRGEATSVSWKPAATPHLESGRRSHRPQRSVIFAKATLELAQEHADGGRTETGWDVDGAGRMPANQYERKRCKTTT
jgi:hypothetical protein